LAGVIWAAGENLVPALSPPQWSQADAGAAIKDAAIHAPNSVLIGHPARSGLGAPTATNQEQQRLAS
jgi:hypothetical protein